MAKKFDNVYEVCKCHHVTLGEIVYAIKEKNAKDIESIGKFSDAGTSCGCCISKEKDIGSEKMELYLNQILNKFVD